MSIVYIHQHDVRDLIRQKVVADVTNNVPLFTSEAISLSSEIDLTKLYCVHAGMTESSFVRDSSIIRAGMVQGFPCPVMSSGAYFCSETNTYVLPPIVEYVTPETPVLILGHASFFNYMSMNAQVNKMPLITIKSVTYKQPPLKCKPELITGGSLWYFEQKWAEDVSVLRGSDRIFHVL